MSVMGATRCRPMALLAADGPSLGFDCGEAEAAEGEADQQREERCRAVARTVAVAAGRGWGHTLAGRRCRHTLNNLTRGRRHALYQLVEARVGDGDCDRRSRANRDCPAGRVVGW